MKCVVQARYCETACGTHRIVPAARERKREPATMVISMVVLCAEPQASHLKAYRCPEMFRHMSQRRWLLLLASVQCQFPSFFWCVPLETQRVGSLWEPLLRRERPSECPTSLEQVRLRVSCLETPVGATRSPPPHKLKKPDLSPASVLDTCLLSFARRHANGLTFTIRLM